MSDFTQAQRERNRGAGTVDTYDRALRAYVRWLTATGVDVLAASTDDVRDYLTWRNDENRRRKHADLSAKRRYWLVSTIHVFYAWAIRTGRATYDPTVGVDRPQADNPDPVFARDDDVVTALSLAPEDDLRAWLTLMAYAGLRCAEVAGLKVGDYERGPTADDDVIRVKGKGRKVRRVGVAPQVADVFRTYGGGRKRSEYLFTRPTYGGPWSPAAVSRRVALYLDDLGLDLTAHSFRHWFGRTLYRVTDNDIRFVQDQLGHASPTTTALYTGGLGTTRPGTFAALGSAIAPTRLRGSEPVGRDRAPTGSGYPLRAVNE